MHRFCITALALIALCGSVSADDVVVEEFEQVVEQQEDVSTNRIAWVVSGVTLACAIGLVGYQVARRINGSADHESHEGRSSEESSRD